MHGTLNGAVPVIKQVWRHSGCLSQSAGNGVTVEGTNLAAGLRARGIQVDDCIPSIRDIHEIRG